MSQNAGKSRATWKQSGERHVSPDQDHQQQSASSCAVAGSDWADVTVHHRYYGSSVLNGGERIIESRHGERPRAPNVRGF
jgi:hypothetical protein